MNNSHLSVKSFLIFGKKAGRVDKTELSLSRRNILRFSFVRKKGYILLRSLRGKSPDNGRYLSAGLPKSPPTSPAKHFEANTKNKNCKSLNFYPLRSKRFHGFLASNFSQGWQDCTSFYVSIGSFLKKKLSKKALFKVNLTLGAEKLNFWQTFSVRFVIADFYVSTGLFKKNILEKNGEFFEVVWLKFFQNSAQFSVP